MDGTSQAVPFVAEVVALLQSIKQIMSDREINDVIVATKDAFGLEKNVDDANVLAYVRDVPVSVKAEVDSSNSEHTHVRAVVCGSQRVLSRTKCSPSC